MGSSSAAADSFMCNSPDAGDGYATLQPVQRRRRSEEDESTLEAKGTCMGETIHDAPLLDINTNKNPDKRKRSTGKRLSQKRSSQPSKHAIVQEEEESFVYNAKHAIMLFVPVTLCMVVVVATVSSTHYYRETEVYLMYTPFHEKTEDTTTLIWQSTANALIMLCLIILTTFFLLMLYTFRFYKVINGWLMLSSVMLLFFLTHIYLEQMLRAFNIPMDYITLAFFMWNFGVVGIISIHWKGPLLLQQGYLIVISAFVALTLIKYLPNWTTYSVLGILVFWDLVAVLCPKGPLRMLLELAQQREEPLFPALIYSSTMLWEIVMADSDQTGQVKKQNTPKTSTEHEDPMTPGGAQLPSTSAYIHSAGPHKPVPKTEEKSSSKNMAKQEISSVDVVPSTDYGRSDSVDFPDVSDPSFISRLQDMYGSEDGGSSIDPPMIATVNSKLQVPKPVQHGHKTSRSRSIKHPHSDKSKSATDNREERGAKLGLGDFIFYGVLVGKASIKGDWNTTLACFVAIHIGLCFTLLLLAIYRTALPALPISLVFGLVFNFATSVLVKPFMESLASNQGHAGVRGNECADYLPDIAITTTSLALDRSYVINAVQDAYRKDG